MAELSVTALTPEEAAAVMNQVDAAYGVLTNPAVDHLMNTPSLQGNSDRRNRPIISLAQYRTLSANKADLSNYVMRYAGPDGRISVNPASKFQKYIGMGLVPVEEFAAKQEEQEALAAKMDSIRLRSEMARDQDGEVVELFRCRVKYEECPRFFDSAKSRETHWGMVHEKTIKTTDNMRRSRGKENEVS